MTCYELESSLGLQSQSYTHPSVMWIFFFFFDNFQIHTHTGEAVRPREAGFKEPQVYCVPHVPNAFLST